MAEKLAVEKASRTQWVAEQILILLTGGVLYYGLEVLWRGWSHWSMAICGALCFGAIYQINERRHTWLFPVRALLGAAVITLAELIAGYVVNIRLGWQIWDYSNRPLQFMGQICLPMSLIWFLLCFPAGWLCRFLRRTVFLREY